MKKFGGHNQVTKINTNNNKINQHQIPSDIYAEKTPHCLYGSPPQNP